ncbi:hypothetical protein FOXYSP1_20482 [Fusarium oxysporum f. sp. phaseoli]
MKHKEASISAYSVEPPTNRNGLGCRKPRSYSPRDSPHASARAPAARA